MRAAAPKQPNILEQQVAATIAPVLHPSAWQRVSASVRFSGAAQLRVEVSRDRSHADAKLTSQQKRANMSVGTTHLHDFFAVCVGKVLSMQLRRASVRVGEYLASTKLKATSHWPP